MLLEMMDIPEIAEDEDIIGWLCAIADGNGWDRQSFMSACFSENITWKKKTFSVMKNYCRIYEKYKGLKFPTPRDMLMRHTTVPVSGLFTPAFYTGILADLILNGSDTAPFEKTGIHSPFVYCPLCAREDMDKAGRIIAHIPHQATGVTACYKHGLKLSEHADVQPEKANIKDIRIANAMYSLYKAQAAGSLENIEGPLRDRITEQGMTLPGKSNNFPVNTAVLGLATTLFTDEELLRIYVKDNDWIHQSALIIRKNSPGSIRFTQEFPLISYTCGRCGERVAQYAVTPLTGGICPVCACRTEWQAKTAMRARYCIDPEYRIVRFHGKTKADIRHIPCGRILEGRSINYIFRNERMICPYCREDRHLTHIGETRRMNCGLTATITAYRSIIDVDIQFEDGRIRTGIQYKNFLLGCIVPGGFYQERHIGETGKMNCGLMAAIMAFRSETDCDIQFETGEVRTGMTYAAFKKGCIDPPGYRTKKHAAERIGKWKMMNCGLKAKIIRYGGSTDCDIVFEDGSVRTGIRYDRFKRGDVAPEGFYLPKVGEERIMKNGLKARIVAVRSSTDIDVQFENGEIRKGIGYQTFCDGFVKSYMLEEQRKKSHIGEVYRQHCGLDAEITDYINFSNCTVVFSNEETRDTVNYGKLKKGKVLPPSLQRRRKHEDGK